MIENILPAEVSSAEAFGDLPGATLFAEEAAIVAGAVEGRRREFTTARSCAREALGRLGVPPVPILSGDRRAPLWPLGTVGSITHCTGYRAAAVAHAKDISAIGLDAEPNKAIPPGVLQAVSSESEQVRLLELMSAAPDICWDRLLFSAKESAYKAWFPATRRWLGFEDAEVTIDPAAGSFDVRLLVQSPADSGLPLECLSGRWLAADDLILTAIAVCC